MICGCRGISLLLFNVKIKSKVTFLILEYCSVYSLFMFYQWDVNHDNAHILF